MYPKTKHLANPEHDSVAAVLAGHTQEITAIADAQELYLLVKPGTDFDGTFRAWDTDAQEFVLVNGWNFCIWIRNGVQ